jgi:hypothetical protein
MLLQQSNIIYWHLSTWVLRRMTKPSIFYLVCTCVMIHSYPIHFHSSPSIRVSHVLLDLPSGHLFDILISMLSKGFHRRQCLVFIQNCNFKLDCPPFSDSAFRHEEIFCFWFLPYFFLSKTSQKFYLYCLQSAQHGNSRITNLHSSKHKHTYSACSTFSNILLSYILETCKKSKSTAASFVISSQEYPRTRIPQQSCA